jgi:hypothetical protein
MAERPTIFPTDQLPAELKTLLEQGHAGDATVLPDLKQAFNENPELSALLGNLAQHAEQALLNLIAGPSLTGREAVVRYADSLRQELFATVASPLERLLAERVVLTWLWSHYADLDVTDRLSRGQGATAACREADKRRHRAHLRFLSATKAFAVVRKLLVKPLSPVELLNKSVAEQSPESMGPRPRPRSSKLEAAAEHSLPPIPEGSAPGFAHTTSDDRTRNAKGRRRATPTGFTWHSEYPDARS